MRGICSALPDALVAVGVMTRVEVPLGVTTEDFWAVGAGVDPPPQPSAANSRGRKSISAAMAYAILEKLFRLQLARPWGRA
jgi:hypothetical protein